MVICCCIVLLFLICVLSFLICRVGLAWVMPIFVNATLESSNGVRGVCGGRVQVWRKTPTCLIWWNKITVHLRGRSYLCRISSFSFWRLFKWELQWFTLSMFSMIKFQDSLSPCHWYDFALFILRSLFSLVLSFFHCILSVYGKANYHDLSHLS